MVDYVCRKCVRRQSCRLPIHGSVMAFASGAVHLLVVIQCDAYQVPRFGVGCSDVRVVQRAATKMSRGAAPRDDTVDMIDRDVLYLNVAAST